MRRSAIADSSLDRDRQEVAHERQRRAVEVAAALDAPVGQDHRVVDRRVELALGDQPGRGRACRARRRAPAACSAASRRPGPASRRTRWLATISESASTRVRLRALTAWPTCGRSACRSAAKARSVPSSASTVIAATTSAMREQRGEVVDRQAQHAEDAVGAVDQRQPLLGAQRDRLRARRAASAAAVGTDCAVGVPHLALADQRQRAVAERREVAAGAERAVLADDRRDAVAEQRRAAGRRAAGRAPERAIARLRARSSSIARTTSRSTGVAHAGGVRAHQRDLQLGGALGRDHGVGERAEAGGDAVHRRVAGDELVDQRRRTFHLGRGRASPSRTAAPVARHGDDVVDPQTASGELDRRSFI